MPICLQGDPAVQGSGFGCAHWPAVTCGDNGLLIHHATTPCLERRLHTHRRRALNRVRLQCQVRTQKTRHPRRHPRRGAGGVQEGRAPRVDDQHPTAKRRDSGQLQDDPVDAGRATPDSRTPRQGQPRPRPRGLAEPLRLAPRRRDDSGVHHRRRRVERGRRRGQPGLHHPRLHADAQGGTGQRRHDVVGPVQGGRRTKLATRRRHRDHRRRTSPAHCPRGDTRSW